MIDDLKPYPDYKDSGSKWFGSIPVQWGCSPLFSVAKPKSVTNCQDRELLSVYLNHGFVRFSDIAEKRANATSTDVSKYQAVVPGNLVLNNQQAWRGSVGISPYVGIVSPAYLVISLSSKLDPHYSNYLFRETTMVSQYLLCSKGVGSIQRNLYWSQLKRVFILIPPIDEQKAIRRYLHVMDSKISLFIRNRRLLIEVLNEQKQAIINRAVTRGLDANVPLKPSGIDWLEYIPEHWDVMPIKRMFSRMDYGISESTSDNGRYCVLTMGNICNGSIVIGECGRVKEVSSEMILDRNDLLFNRTNSLELVGKVGIFEGAHKDNITYASYLVRMKANDRVLPGYANTLLNSKNVISFARQNAIPSLHQANLNPTRYGRLPVPLPPLKEQKRILDYIEKHCSSLEEGIQKAQREIDLIREYRTRLISDVVTGKVDVRHLAPARGSGGLEEKLDELEPLDEVVSEPGEEALAEEVSYAD